MHSTATHGSGSDYASVAQLAERFPAFTQSSLRWLLAQRRANGLERAVIRVGRRVLISVPRFVEWLESRGESEGGNAT